MRKNYELKVNSNIWSNVPYFEDKNHDNDVTSLCREIMGMSDIDAIMFLQSEDYVLRIVKEDKEERNYTQELNEKRINVAIEGNVVTEIVGIF